MDNEQFSVWVFLPDGYHFDIGRWLDAKTALRYARRAIQAERYGGPFAQAQRIIVTDGGDCTVFEWRAGEGVVHGMVP